MPDENLETILKLAGKLDNGYLFIILIFILLSPFAFAIINMVKESKRAKREADAEREKAEAFSMLSANITEKMDDIKSLFISSMTKLRRNFVDLDNAKMILRLSQLRVEYRAVKSVYNILITDDFLSIKNKYSLMDKLDTPLLNVYKENENDLRKIYYNMLNVSSVLKRDALLGLIADLTEKMNIAKEDGNISKTELFEELLEYLNNYFETQREKSYDALMKAQSKN